MFLSLKDIELIYISQMKFLFIWFKNYWQNLSFSESITLHNLNGMFPQIYFLFRICSTEFTSSFSGLIIFHFWMGLKQYTSMQNQKLATSVRNTVNCLECADLIKNSTMVKIN